MTQKIDFGQIKPIVGPFYATPDAPAAPPISQSARTMLGLAWDHTLATDDSANSTSSLTIGTGPRTLGSLSDQVPADEATWLSRFAVGERVRAYASETNWIEGLITARSFGSMTIDVDTTNGTGTHTDWHVARAFSSAWAHCFDSPGSISRVTGWDYGIDKAQAVSVVNSGVALSGMARTQGGNGLGITAFMLNNSATARSGWGGYFDAAHTTTAFGAVTHGIEVEISRPNGEAASLLGGLDPYKSGAPGRTVCASFGVGSDAAVYGRSGLVDAITGRGNNGAAAYVGEVFRWNVLAREVPASRLQTGEDYQIIAAGSTDFTAVGADDNDAGTIFTATGSTTGSGLALSLTSPGQFGYAKAQAFAAGHGSSWWSRDLLSVTAGAFEVGKDYIIDTLGTTDFTEIGASANTNDVQFTATGAGAGDGTAKEVNSRAEVFRLYCDVTDARHRSGLIFTNGGMQYRDRSVAGHAILQADYAPDVETAVRVTPGTVGAASAIIAAYREGGGNADLRLQSAGTGRIRFGDFTSSADAAITGYVEIKTDDGTTRKLAVIA